MSRRSLCGCFKRLGASRAPLPPGSYPLLDVSLRERRRFLSVVLEKRQAQVPDSGIQQRTCRNFSITTRAYQKVAQNSGERSHEETGQARSSGKLLAVSSVIAIASLAAAAFFIDPIGALLDDTSIASFVVRFRRGKPMNEDTFVPFVVTSKEQISSTSFVITIRPQGSSGTSAERQKRPQIHDLHSNKKVLKRAWEHGLWSVEIKQPQLQIARNYTPLPPKRGDEEDELHSGALRFLIRRYNGGEVSTYLSRLSVGDQVELRGPHLGFDIKKRLGDARRLVFLAGGTGIAPALQAVHVLHKTDQTVQGVHAPLISILWANRRREDCLVTDVSSHTHNVIVQQLQEMKQESPKLLDVKYVVDEEKTYIGANDILNLVGTRDARQNEVALPMSSDNCRYHSARSIENIADGDPVSQADCPCLLRGQSKTAGKNVVMISGPDGFIQHYAGPKRWTGGEELQGPVLGVIGQLKRKYPVVWTEWIVLKL